MTSVETRSISKKYENGFEAVKKIDLKIDDGEFLVLVGPSGCGKSTLLRMLAGLEEITSGELLIDGQVVNDMSPKERDVAMVFQNYALYPHMTVRDNISFALNLAKVDSAEIKSRVERTASLLELEALLDRKPSQLSGGQRQRVAMGRAIVRQPSLYLMDEPLSNLDARLRIHMRAEIIGLQSELNVTTVYVTHDQVEAMTMGTRVAVLNHGVVQQVATPQELYNHPANLFVASFIGAPAMNLYNASVRYDQQDTLLVLGEQTLTVPNLGEKLGPDDREIVLGIRPDALGDVQTVDQQQGTTLNVRVNMVEALGSDLIVHSDLHGASSPQDIDALGEDPVQLGSDEQSARCIARLSPDAVAQVGEQLNLSVDISKLHFFDPISTLRILAD